MSLNASVTFLFGLFGHESSVPTSSNWTLQICLSEGFVNCFLHLCLNMNKTKRVAFSQQPPDVGLQFIIAYFSLLNPPKAGGVPSWLPFQATNQKGVPTLKEADPFGFHDSCGLQPWFHKRPGAYLLLRCQRPRGAAPNRWLCTSAPWAGFGSPPLAPCSPQGVDFCWVSENLWDIKLLGDSSAQCTNHF